MKVDATVKNYHMKMVQGGESIEGMFTGRVMTQVDQSLGTIPVQATYDLSDKVRLKLGPYFSYVSSHKFSGYAYDGYLREGSPTGPKIELGNDAGVDWYFSKRWGGFAGLTWGLSEVFKKNFSVIEQPMYPIYGEIGLIYQLK